MDEIEKLLKEKNDILIDIGLQYIEKLRLEKRLDTSVKIIQNVDYRLSQYEYEDSLMSEIKKDV